MLTSLLPYTISPGGHRSHLYTVVHTPSLRYSRVRVPEVRWTLSTGHFPPVSRRPSILACPGVVTGRPEVPNRVSAVQGV